MAVISVCESGSMEHQTHPTNGTTLPPVADAKSASQTGPVGAFDRFAERVREATPAWVVNNGSRINFAIKGLADSMSIASSVRRGSQAPARLAANLITLGSLIPGSIYQEKQITAEEASAEAQLNPLQYIGHRLKYALNPRDHVVETVGVATMLNGALTVASGLAQSSRRQWSWELLTGACTVAAGSALTFMRDRQRAWQTWTGIFIGRMPFKALQSEQAWNRGYTDRGIRPGDKYQGANLGLQLFGNVFSTFYGGVKKMPDGTIVHLGEGEQVPQAKLTHVAEHERAMPAPSSVKEVA